jgi:hypothetical protein
VTVRLPARVLAAARAAKPETPGRFSAFYDLAEAVLAAAPTIPYVLTPKAMGEEA